MNNPQSSYVLLSLGDDLVAPMPLCQCGKNVGACEVCKEGWIERAMRGLPPFQMSNPAQQQSEQNEVAPTPALPAPPSPSSDEEDDKEDETDDLPGAKAACISISAHCNDRLLHSLVVRRPVVAMRSSRTLKTDLPSSGARSPATPQGWTPRLCQRIRPVIGACSSTMERSLGSECTE